MKIYGLAFDFVFCDFHLWILFEDHITDLLSPLALVFHP
jgi:hypothetical protein